MRREGRGGRRRREGREEGKEENDEAGLMCIAWPW
jgi:hypothetical protein